MDAYLMQQIMDAIGRGDAQKFLGYIAIFGVLWLEVRGLKKELVKLNQNVSDSLHAGELRFEKIEENVSRLEHRFTVFETKQQGDTHAVS